MSDQPTIKAILIGSDLTIEDVSLCTLEDFQKAVGGFIEAVSLNDGSIMYLNEEGRIQSPPLPYNDIATSLCHEAGRTDLVLDGILGDVVIAGPVDDEGWDTDATDWVRDLLRGIVEDLRS